MWWLVISHHCSSFRNRFEFNEKMRKIRQLISVSINIMVVIHREMEDQSTRLGNQWQMVSAQRQQQTLQIIGIGSFIYTYPLSPWIPCIKYKSERKRGQKHNGELIMNITICSYGYEARADKCTGKSSFNTGLKKRSDPVPWQKPP